MELLAGDELGQLLGEHYDGDDGGCDSFGSCTIKVLRLYALLPGPTRKVVGRTASQWKRQQSLAVFIVLQQHQQYQACPAFWQVAIPQRSRELGEVAVPRVQRTQIGNGCQSRKTLDMGNYCFVIFIATSY